MFKTLKEKVTENKTRITMLAITLMGMVASVSAVAVDFTAITTLVNEIVLIMPYVVSMVIAAIPIYSPVKSRGTDKLW